MSKRKYNPAKRRRSYLSTGRDWCKQPKRRYQESVRRAKRCNVPWVLSFDEFAVLIVQPCIYGGAPPIPHMGSGLDQKIPGDGYTQANAIPCCVRHNLMKMNTLTHEDMMFLLAHRPHLRPCSYDKVKVTSSKPTDWLLEE